MRRVTEKQRQTLVFIELFTEEKGYPPTYQEMAKRFGVTKGAIQDRVKWLIRKGRLEKQFKQPRTFVVKESGKKVAGV